MALGRKTGGRQKGSKNAKTIAKSAGKLAIVDHVDAVASKSSPVRAKRGKAPSIAPKGISPKDLMLTGMRDAWDKHYGLMDAADAQLAAARLLPDGTQERVDATEKAVALREAAAAALEQATDLAVKAAPYEHPKLANVDNRVRGNVLVQLAKF